MDRITLARQYGCLHCITSKDFTEKIDPKNNEKQLICNHCGCIHTESSYEYRISAQTFEDKKFIVQRSYQENEVMMEEYKQEKEKE
jgi:transcription initiation factor TFIIIB Brf1 subunit/transcription initiation factor TFIIB